MDLGRRVRTGMEVGRSLGVGSVMGCILGQGRSFVCRSSFLPAKGVHACSVSTGERG
jgi:hypothetical protein